MAVLRRMLLVAAIIGTSVTITATEHVDAWLVLSGTAGWSFVPLLQLATGLFLLRGARVPLAVALDRYFGTHWPWSLWILTVHAALLLVPWLRGYSLFLVVTIVVPMAVTGRLLVNLHRDMVKRSHAAAVKRVIAHQALTYGIVLLYVQLAVALWPRILWVFA